MQSSSAIMGIMRVATILLPGLLYLTTASTLSAEDRSVASIQLMVQFDPRIFETVDVELICSMEKRRSRIYAMTRNEPRVLELGHLEERGNSCQIRALLPAGYTVVYSVSGDNAYRADDNGCQFTDIDPGETSQCRVEVFQKPVRLTVYKKWIGPSGEEPDVQVILECEGGDYSGERFINEGKPDGWDIVNIGPDGVLCNVSEEVRETYRPDIIDCQGLWLLPGKGEECTMLNTKIVKRIEMLNRYGIVVMILLVLGVGLIAVRRLT